MPATASRRALPPGPSERPAVQAARWGLRYPEFTARARARFGSTYTVRLGGMEPAVLTTDADAIRLLLTGDPLTRASANDVLRPLVGERAILLLGPAEHLRRRRLLLPAFHGERIARYRATVEDLVTAELDGWPQPGTHAVLPAAQRITLEVILSAVLGVSDPDLRTKLRALIDDLLGYPVVPALRRVPGLDGRGATAIGTGHGPLHTAAAVLSPAVTTYFPALKTRRLRNFAVLPWYRLFDRLEAEMAAQVAQTRADPGLQDRGDVLAMLVQARHEDGSELSDTDLSTSCSP